MSKDFEQNNRYHIRKMMDGDIPQAIEIDLDAFPNQWPHPSSNSFHHELRNKLAHYIVICQGSAPQNSGNGHKATGFKEVALYIKNLFLKEQFFGPDIIHPTGDHLAGMAGIWMMVDEAHIVTIAVRKTHRHRGLGEWLLINIVDLARQLQARYVTLEVRVSNTTAQALYGKYGFTIAGTRRKYYSDNGEDAFIMTTCELDSSSYQSKLQQLREEHRSRWSHCYPEY